MPKPRIRRIIPIVNKKSSVLEFRFVGGVLNVEPSGSKMIWASCLTSQGTEKPKPPQFMTRSLGSIGGVVEFKIAKPLKFPQPCNQDLTRQSRDREQIRV